MYSPKISEDLIRVLYRLALKEKVAMTKIVDDILRNELHERGLIDAKENSGKYLKRNVF